MSIASRIWRSVRRSSCSLVRCTASSLTGSATDARSATIATVMTSSIRVKPRAVTPGARPPAMEREQRPARYCGCTPPKGTIVPPGSVAPGGAADGAGDDDGPGWVGIGAKEDGEEAAPSGPPLD